MSELSNNLRPNAKSLSGVSTDSLKHFSTKELKTLDEIKSTGIILIIFFLWAISFQSSEEYLA
jgi:hypothetical protein